MDHKITIFNDRLFREIRLSRDLQTLRIGTEPGCEVRIRADLFPVRIRLLLENRQECWRLSCLPETFLDGGDVRKLASVSFKENASYGLFCADTRERLLGIEFSPDPDEEGGYERHIDISEFPVISIGAREKNRLVLLSEYAGKEELVLKRMKEGSLEVTLLGSGTGICINGSRAAPPARIRNGDFFSIADYHFYYENGRLQTAARMDLKINGLPYADLPDRNTYPRFCRKTRVKEVFDKTPVQILDPPEIPAEQKENILLRILPSLGMLAAAFVMALRGSQTMLIFSGISAGAAAVTSAAGVFSGKRKYRDALEKRKETYEAYIAEKKRQIRSYRNKERETAQMLYCSAAQLLDRIDRFSPDLFDRNPEDEDFLCVRLGTGTVKARRMVNCTQHERLCVQDELQMLPEKLCLHFERITGYPVVCDLKEINALGVAGSRQERTGFLKIMILDLAARHFPEDVKMIFAASPSDAETVCGLRMLPHVFLDGGNVRGIAVDEESRDHVFEYLYKELSQREISGVTGSRLVVFLSDDAFFRSHPLSRFLKKAKDLGAVFIFSGDHPERIPDGCDRIVILGDGGKGMLISSDDAADRTEFDHERISDQAMEQMVSTLAPVYSPGVSLGNRLETYIPLYSLLGIYCVQDLDLKQRWADSDIQSSMAVPIGRSGSGILYLDIHDKAMGPHGLIAGTTGSGKSELLQTFILSAAVTFHPQEAAFLIIDFKGGGMASSLKDLPHMAGVITNIDEREITRSLKFIKAELIKRQKLFEETQVNHIDSYIRKYKEGKAAAALPHLIIIADEFAELKAQQPEFMKELISAARIGRSLGVHLILATQKPSGQVDEQIWSNSRFRICLKVQNAGDSNEVLRSPLAAQIREPGRAYLQVGNHEVFELFQSACSAGPEYYEEGGAGDFKICSVSISGKRKVIYDGSKKGTKSGKTPEEDPGNGITEALALVRHIKDYCEKEHISCTPQIINPVLEPVTDFPEGRSHKQEECKGLWARIGIYDDPDRQFQGEYAIDLSEHNLMITGASRSGKTNLLCSIIRSISTVYSSEEANIYIIDYASMSLRSFESLKCVGGVACTGDDEGTRQIFRFLTRQLQIRKEMSGRKEKEGKLPHLLLVIDNLTALKELYLQDDQELLTLCREGVSVGISIVAANPRISGIGYRYLTDFSSRIALHCNESGEYGYLFGRCSLQPADLPGRCLIEINRQQYECQTYRAFRDSGGKQERQELEEFITMVNSRNVKEAQHIPVIPQRFTPEAAKQICADTDCGRFGICAGLDYENVDPCMMDLSEAAVLAIAGRKRSGGYNWLSCIVNMLSDREETGVEIFAADGITRRLSWLNGHKVLAGYGIWPEDSVQSMIRIRDILAERYRKISRGQTDLPEKEPLLMLVLDNMDAVMAICSDPQAFAAYREVTGKYAQLNVCIIVYVENSAIPYNAPEILKTIRDEKHCLYFDEIRNFKLFDLPGTAIKNMKGHFAAGDAFYIRNGDVRRLRPVQQ